MRKYYSAGTVRVAMRQNGEVSYLLGDHLGGTSLTLDAAGNKVAELRYRAWGETRYSQGSTPTTYRYTGQREASEIGLYFYNARWYDPYLNRWIQPDPIVPSASGGNNPNAIGYVTGSNYSPLVVDYHENRFLGQLNQENRERLENPQAKFPSVPTNPLAFDRYSYTFGNPVKYNDPSGHCIWDLCIVEGIGIVEVSIAAIATFATIEATQPGRPEAFAQSLVDMGEQAAQGLGAIFSKGEYVPDSLSGEKERAAYREALHRYKDAYNLGARDNVEKKVLDKMAELVKQGMKPNDIVDKLPQPPEEDWEDDWDGEE